MEESRLFAKRVVRKLDIEAQKVLRWESALEYVEEKGEFAGWLRYGRSLGGLRRKYDTALNKFMNTGYFSKNQNTEDKRVNSQS